VNFLSVLLTIWVCFKGNHCPYTNDLENDLYDNCTATEFRNHTSMLLMYADDTMLSPSGLQDMLNVVINATNGNFL